MNQPPFHTSAGHSPDATQTPSFDEGPLTLGPEWGNLEGVVLFDPETDTSPYARAGKSKKSARAAGAKPSVKLSAKAKAKAAQFASYDDPQPAADEPGVPLEDKPAARRGGLRIVPTDDTAEIRRLAEAQRRTEATRAAAHEAPFEQEEDADVPREDADGTGAGFVGLPFVGALFGKERTQAGRPANTAQDAEAQAKKPVHSAYVNPHGTPGNTGAFSSVPAFSSFKVVDDEKPSARGSLFAGSAAKNSPIARNEEPVRKRRDPEALWRAGIVWVTVAATLVVSLVMLYFPAQELYLAVRENERLTNELELNLARNSLMQERVAALQTPEGIQDEAHRVYDLVLPGEHAVQVIGVDYEEPTGIAPAEIPRGSGENTHTWATNLLDRVFGVTGPDATTAAVEDVATVTEDTGVVAGADIVAQGDGA